MKLGILHLSDMHLHGKDDSIIKKALLLARASFETAHSSDGFLIAFTGDIAYSGTKEQYDLASHFLTEIKSEIERETERAVSIIVIPGNHDCSLIPINPIRNLVIENLVRGEQLKPEYVELCSSAQQNYFEFEANISTEKPISESVLWKEYEIAIAGKLVRVSALNAAWMSRIPEVQGQLIFPIAEYMELLEAPSTLRLGLIHHPLNWYCQGSYHPLRNALKAHCSAILSGHEHSLTSEVVTSSNGQDTLMIEAPALQGHDPKDASEFCCLLFDIESNVVIEKKFTIGTDQPVQIGTDNLHTLNFDTRGGAKHKINNDFFKHLTDPGGNFTHPESGSVSAENVFVYPELEVVDSELEKDTFYADELIYRWRDGGMSLLLGDEESGKSFLLNKAYLDIHTQGGLPIYIKSADIKSITDRDLDRVLEKIAGDQYEKPNDFKYASKSLKVALLDDIDRLPGGLRLQEKLIKYLEQRFGSVIITANAKFKLNELVGRESAETLAATPSYKIKPFGYLMRNRLIKKWCLLGDVESLADLDKKVHSIENSINLVLGKNLVPARPIYILIFLQSTLLAQQGHLQNSSLSHYYEFLITKSLTEAGLSKDQLDEVFTYLSWLAWFFKCEGTRELESHQLARFNSQFTELMTTVDLGTRLELLTKAKILTCSGSHYRFTYSYIYYLFVGKYFSDHLHNPDIKSEIIKYCGQLHVREYANIVLFVTHHTNNPVVMDEISRTLKGCFSEYGAIRFEDDVAPISNLVESVASLVIEEVDVQKNQDKQKRMADRYDDQDEVEPEDTRAEKSSDDKDAALDLSNKLNLTIKTSEILGSITKTHYGSIDRSRKMDHIEQIFSGSLRALNAAFAGILDNPESFVQEIERVVRDRYPSAPDDGVKDQAKKIAFQLVGMISTGLIARTGQLISSDKIREDVVRFISNKRTNANRLVGIASCLMQPGHLPFGEIESLAKELKENLFAFTILQSLIYYHLHMFHTSDRDKQRLASSVGISMKKSRLIDIKSRKSKMSTRP
nr:hypothetical protein [Pseudomonas syringae pv. actinidiae]